MSTSKHLSNLGDSVKTTGFLAAIVAAIVGNNAAAQSSGEAQGSRASALEEVVVTARRREESAINVPIAIAVVSGDKLAEDSITRTQDLQYLVPGLSVSTFLGGANVSLRGVGTGRNVSGTDESVGVYIDEIYQGTTSSAFSRMFDVERVEVLKGPQGTLYGRNVTAGAINVISRAPEFGGLSGSADLSYGSYDTVRGNLALNIPLGEKTAMRVAMTGANGDGYVKNIDTGKTMNGEDYLGGRVRLRSEVTDAFTVDASVQYLEDDTGVAFEMLPFEANYLGFQRTRGPASFNSNSQEVLNSVLRMDYKLSDAWLLRSITGYMDLTNEHRFSGPPSAPNPEVDGAWQIDRPEYNQFSQELQAQWSSGRNTATIGVYYLDSTLTDQRQICYCLFGLPDYANAIDDGPVDAWAVFGESEFGITDSLSLIAGIRYGEETRKLTVSAGNPPGLTDPVSPVSGDENFSAPTGRLGLRYQPTADTSIYATVSRGFKSGGVQRIAGDTGDVVGSFDPEYLNAFEVGVKHALADIGLLEAAAFYYDYTDLQVFQAVSVFDFRVVNAPEATIKGVDFNAQFRLADHWGLDLTAAYLDATYDEFIYTGQGGSTVDLAGYTLPRSPEWSSSAQLAFDNFEAFNRWMGSLRAELNYRDSVVSVPDTPARMEKSSLPSVTLLNFVARLDPLNSGGLGLFLNLRNLTEEEYYEFNGGGGLIGAGSAPGRTYEFGMSYRF